MKSRSVIRIAVLLPAEPEYAGRLLEGAILYAEEMGGVEVLDLPYLSDRGCPVVNELPAFDGALVWLRPRDTWVGHLLARGVMVVNTSGDQPPEVVPMVAFQGSSVIATAVAHLGVLGRSQAAYVGADIATSTALKWRVERYCEACARAGMRTEVLDLGVLAGIDDRMTRLSASQQRMLDRFLRSLHLPAVAWCDDDHLAQHLCQRAMHCGLEVPGHLAVLGMFDYRIARSSRPSISSIPQPGQLIGRRATQWIHESIRDGRRCEGLIALPSPAVQVRDSTRCERRGNTPYHDALEAIRNHACEGLSVGEVMDGMRMSQRTFSRRFAALFGRTPGAEIRRVKAEQAKTYLLSTGHSVERIADLCGFSEQGKFSNFFKRETGMTPTGFRKFGERQ
ncbi:MAG: helix-turn-helix domain-containing protein [Verrucomicrobia bacterium]|nr:helix-turn-helix domain-containing protein [Verrucomicrobiota bacterium]